MSKTGKSIEIESILVVARTGGGGVGGGGEGLGNGEWLLMEKSFFWG